MNCNNANVTRCLLDGKDPARIALRMIGRDHSYGEVQAASTELAKHLMAGGGQKGEPVLLIGDNSFFWVAAYLGVLRVGMVCVPLPTNISDDDLDYILLSTGARLAFVVARFAMLHKDRLQEIRLVTDTEVPFANALSFAKVREVVSASEDMPDVETDDLAALMFTSGSTGRPRGVMVSHGNIMSNTESIVQYLGLTENDRIMTVLPFHYCFGTSLLHTHLRVGGTLVVDSRFMYPEAVLQQMVDTECTGFAGVPSHFQILLRSTSLRKKQFPNLRYVQQAGGHLAPAFIRELQEALPATEIFVMYGQTEATARLSYLPPKFLDRKLGSIGKGMPGVTLHVLKESGSEVQPGEVGEIVAEGKNVARGYWRAIEETVRCFRGGKLYTGDLATVDEDGFIYIVDRARDFLKCGGKRISCQHIEDELLRCDVLLEAAVIGVPDEMLGEAVKAFVVPRLPDRSGELKESVRLFCKRQLPPQLVPREIVVLQSLPKNSAGKVLKRNLKTL